MFYSNTTVNSKHTGLDHALKGNQGVQLVFSTSIPQLSYSIPQAY